MELQELHLLNLVHTQPCHTQNGGKVHGSFHYKLVFSETGRFREVPEWQGAALSDAQVQIRIIIRCPSDLGR